MESPRSQSVSGFPVVANLDGDDAWAHEQCRAPQLSKTASDAQSLEFNYNTTVITNCGRVMRHQISI